MGKNSVTGLTDLIKTEQLQAIQDGLASLTGMSVRIIDNTGAGITKTSLPAYRRFRAGSDEQENRAWGRACKKALETAGKTGEAFIGAFPSGGARYALVPMGYKQRVLGNWLVKEIKPGKSGDPGAEQKKPLPELDPESGPAEEETDLEGVSVFFDTFTGILTGYALIGRTGKTGEGALSRAEEKLEAAVNRMLNCIPNSDAAEYVTDIQTNAIAACNKNYAHIFISQPKDLLGKPCFSFHGYGDLCPYCPLPKLIKKNDGGSLEWTARPEHLDLWIRARSRVIKAPDGRLRHYVRYRDITGYKKIKDTLSYIACYDPVLKIPNAVLLAKNLAGDPCSSLICLGLRGLGRAKFTSPEPAPGSEEPCENEIRELLLPGIIRWIRGIIGGDMALYRITEHEFVLLAQGYAEGDVKNAALAVYQRFNHPWELAVGGTVRGVTVPVSMGIIPWTRDTGSGLVRMVQTVLDMGEKNDVIFAYEKLETAGARLFGPPPLDLYQVDVKKLTETSGGYTLSGGGYRLINQSINLLYAGPPRPESLEQVLGLTGSYLNVSRAYIVVIDHDIGEISHEWCAADILPEKDHMTHFFVSGKWRDALEQEGLILVSDINTLELKIRVEMARQHVTSVAALPLLKDRRLWGFIGIDECKVKQRRWKPEEIQLLRQISLLISGRF
jgi:PAS domain-containing protein